LYAFSNYDHNNYYILYILFEVFFVKKINIFLVLLIFLLNNFFIVHTAIDERLNRWGHNNMTQLSVNELLSGNEYVYNHKLAQKSFEFAVSAFSSQESMEFWGENAYCGRENTVKKILEESGFTDLNFYNYNVSLNKSVTKSAFATGIKRYDSDTIIVAIIIRGGRYGLEWADNFNIGDSSYNYHKGFYESALQVKKISDSILERFSDNEKIKIWITGYSRGGAIANILASMYDREKVEKIHQVYGYTFASPKTTIISGTSCHDKLYDNIFNILSQRDPIYNIPPSKWGFGRFGICVVFPDITSNEITTDKSIIDSVYEDYRSRTGKELILSTESVKSLIDLLIKSSSDRDFFDKYLSKPISDLIIIKMMREKNINGKWERVPINVNIVKLYNEEFIDEIEKLKNNYLFTSLKKIGVNIPDDFYVFILLCRQNGYMGYENIIYTNLSLEELSDLTVISSGGIKFIEHTTDFYHSIIFKIPYTEVKFVAE